MAAPGTPTGGPVVGPGLTFQHEGLHEDPDPIDGHHQVCKQAHDKTKEEQVGVQISSSQLQLLPHPPTPCSQAALGTAPHAHVTGGFFPLRAFTTGAPPASASTQEIALDF